MDIWEGREKKTITGLKLKAVRRVSSNKGNPMDIIHSNVLTPVIAKPLCSFLCTHTHTPYVNLKLAIGFLQIAL